MSPNLELFNYISSPQELDKKTIRSGRKDETYGSISEALYTVRLVNNNPRKINRTNFPRLCDLHPHLMDHVLYAYTLQTDRVFLDPLLNMGIDNIPYEDLFARQFIIQFPSFQKIKMKFYNLSADEKQAIKLPYSGQRNIVKDEVPPEEAIPDLDAFTITKEPERAVNTTLAIKLMVESLRSGSMEEVQKFLETQHVSFYALLDGFQELSINQLIKDLQAREILSSTQKFFALLEDWATYCAMQSVQKEGREKDCFPFNYKPYNDDRFPPIELIPHILDAHVNFLYSLPLLVQEGQEFSWGNILKETTQLLKGTPEIGQLPFYESAVLIEMLKDPKIQFTKLHSREYGPTPTIAEVYPLISSGLKDRIQAILPAIQSAQSSILYLLEILRKNPALINKKDVEEETGDSYIKHYGEIEDEIRQAGGKAPKSLRHFFPKKLSSPEEDAR
jgi:hypothetical protein